MRYIQRHSYMVIIILLSYQLVIAQAIKLTWEPNSETDIRYYEIFKGASQNPQQAAARIFAPDTAFYDYDIQIGGKYYYRIVAVDTAGNASDFSNEILIEASDKSPVQEVTPAAIPDEFGIIQNYPNPFNPETTIKYNVAQEGAINLSIYDVLGKKVIELVNNYKKPGYYFCDWNGNDSFGNECSSGIYFCQLKTHELTKTIKVMLTR